MTEPAYVYAINANDGGLASYPDLLDNSLDSLRPYLDDPAQVHVIYAPPDTLAECTSYSSIHERAGFGRVEYGDAPMAVNHRVVATK